MPAKLRIEQLQSDNERHAEDCPHCPCLAPGGDEAFAKAYGICLKVLGGQFDRIEVEVADIVALRFFSIPQSFFLLDYTTQAGLLPCPVDVGLGIAPMFSFFPAFRPFLWFFASNNT